MDKPVRTITTVALAAVTLAGIMAVSPAEAASRYRGGGARVAAGVFGGLALGALAAGMTQRHYAPRVLYRNPCHFERRPAYDRWGRFAGYHRIRVCY